jgi:hypothetical protein
MPTFPVSSSPQPSIHFIRYTAHFMSPDYHFWRDLLPSLDPLAMQLYCPLGIGTHSIGKSHVEHKLFQISL